MPGKNSGSGIGVNKPTMRNPFFCRRLFLLFLLFLSFSSVVVLPNWEALLSRKLFSTSRNVLFFCRLFSSFFFQIIEGTWEIFPSRNCVNSQKRVFFLFLTMYSLVFFVFFLGGGCSCIFVLLRYLGSIPVPETASTTTGSNGGVSSDGAIPMEEAAGDARGPSVVSPWEEPLRARGDVTPLDVRFPPTKVLRHGRVL